MPTLEGLLSNIQFDRIGALGFMAICAFGLLSVFAISQYVRRRRLLSPTSVLTQEVRRTYTLPALRGCISAQAAFKAAQTALLPFDPNFRMTLISTGDHVNSEGISACWEMYFDLPSRAARAVCTIQPLDPRADVADQELFLDFVLRPTPALWKPEEAGSYLPLEFRDSPEAVQSLIGQGKDFLDTDTRHILAAKILPSGKAVWSTTAYDTEYRTEFT